MATPIPIGAQAHTGLKSTAGMININGPKTSDMSADVHTHRAHQGNPIIRICTAKLLEKKRGN
ncbi:hypothetical protein [Mycobacteroides salmoniphilum]|uniref:hypothetical protein n=1 Tax=Mycobacteroides salmoniphilum TaxID=404941 RepID=UPI001F3193E3|nr:hypothetical protein [Mycobacteroides salmoniphilum]